MKYEIHYQIEIDTERHGEHVFLLMPAPQEFLSQKILGGSVFFPEGVALRRDSVYQNLYAIWKSPQKNIFGWKCCFETTAIKSISQKNDIWKKAYEIYDWVIQSLEYGNPILGLYSAREAKEKKCVDCGGFASLFVEKCVEIGIEARVVVGFWTTKSLYAMHAWAEFRSEEGEWIPVDPSVEKLRRAGRTKKQGGFGYIEEDRIILSVGSSIPIEIGEKKHPVDILQNPILFSEEKMEYRKGNFFAKCL